MIDAIDFGSRTPFFIGYGCMLLALVFWFIWPKAKAQPYGKGVSWPRYILHYFHPLAWVCFGLGTLLLVRQPILAGLFYIIGAIALLVFVVIAIKE